MTAQRSADLFSLKTPRVFSIDAGRPFLADLAAALAATVPPGDPLALADIEILLPTRRAARALNEAFVSVANGCASLLPRIRPLGDVDEDEIALDTDFFAEQAELPPAISSLERRLVLARMVAAAFSVVIIVLLWLAILATIIAFAKISKPAAWLLVPYIAWVSFAIYLNYSIYALN